LLIYGGLGFLSSKYEIDEEFVGRWQTNQPIIAGYIIRAIHLCRL
jgi:hypothetical protein